MHKQHPQTAYRKYAVLIGAIFENCDKKSRQPILKLPTSFEPIGTIHQLVCDGVKRPAWRTISANQPNHNHKIQHKCNAQQHHQKFSHTFFSFCLMIPSLFCPHYTDWAGRYDCPSYTYHKKGTRHSHFECTVFLWIRIFSLANAIRYSLMPSKMKSTFVPVMAMLPDRAFL